MPDRSERWRYGTAMSSMLRDRTQRRVKKLARTLLGLRALEDLSVDERRAMWPPAASLDQQRLDNCRVIESRDAMLVHMPKQGVCAEVGIWQCTYSKKIFEVTSPTKLHLIDIDPAAIQGAKTTFASEVRSGRVETHLGDSATVLDSMPDSYFDWIYVDGDHSYEGVRRDLAAARPKLKAGGYLAMNDYIYFEPSGFSKYGVIEAVNEFCLEYDFEMVFLALNPRTYNDVVIRQRGLSLD